MAIFFRGEPPDLARPFRPPFRRTKAWLGRNEPTEPEGSFPRNPVHHQTQLGFPTRLIHSSPDPTKVRVSDRNRASKQHQKNTWNGASQQIQAKERPLFSRQVSYSKGWVSHGYQCNVHGQFLRQSVTSRTSMDSISGPFCFCTIKYPAYRP